MSTKQYIPCWQRKGFCPCYTTFLPCFRSYERYSMAPLTVWWLERASQSSTYRLTKTSQFSVIFVVTFLREFSYGKRPAGGERPIRSFLQLKPLKKRCRLEVATLNMDIDPSPRGYRLSTPIQGNSIESAIFWHGVDSPARTSHWNVNGAIWYSYHSVLQGIWMVKVSWNMYFGRELVRIVPNVNTNPVSILHSIYTSSRTK